MSFGASLGNVATFGLSQGAASDDQESALIAQLLQQSQGQGPNPALLQLKQQTDANNAAATGQIASAGGMSPALRQRQILEAQQAGNQREAGQGARLQAEQQLGAENMLGSNISNQRAQNNAQAFPVIQGVMSGASSALGQGSTGSGGGGNGDTALPSDADGIMEYRGGQVPAGYAQGGAVQMMAGGGLLQNGVSSYLPMLAALLAHGGPVPGQAKVPGNSPRNDIVPAQLSPGEIVLPRTVTKAKDAPEKARAFVQAIRRKKVA